jgi:GR25 family glycosyltransferase involved in LPS biosynthesis
MLDYFDKVFVINLDKRSDRWSKVIESFKKINFSNYERFSAIESPNGWEGCKASHLSIIKKAKDNGYNNVLIFEDDFILADNFNEIINTVLEQIPPDWDMLYFGGNTVRCKQIESISENILKVDSMLAAHCYAIKNTLYDKILSEANTIENQRGFLRGKAIDVYYSEFICKNYNTYLTKPMLVFQEEGYSDIEKKMVNYKHMIK